MASGLAIGIRISLGGARYPDPFRLDPLK